jgi:hypothetical protein
VERVHAGRLEGDAARAATVDGRDQGGHRRRTRTDERHLAGVRRIGKRDRTRFRYPLQCRLTARRGSGHDAVITTALAAYTEADGVTASRLADRALHDAIAAAAGNEHLALLARELSSRVNLGFNARDGWPVSISGSPRHAPGES